MRSKASKHRCSTPEAQRTPIEADEAHPQANEALNWDALQTLRFRASFHFCVGALILFILAPRGAFGQLEFVAEAKPICIFGDGARKVTTIWHNPTDSLAEAAIRLRLYQVSSDTAAPVSDSFWKRIEVLPGQTIFESTQLRLSAVTAETRFIIQWIAQSNHILGKSEILAYPRDLLSELKPLVGALPLGVYDPQNTLKPMLKTLLIDVIDLQQVGLEQFQGRLAILGPFETKGEMGESFGGYVKELARKGIGVVWLQPSPQPREPLKPSFCVLAEGRGTIVMAQSGLVANLSENPESQLNLMELSRLATHPEKCTKHYSGH